MASCKFNINGKEVSSALSKITRDDLYGSTTTRVLGPGDEVLTKAGVPEDGKLFLTRADLKYAPMIGEDYTMKPSKVVNALNGEPVEQIASSFSLAPSFRPATTEELTQFEVSGIYSLDDLQLPAGEKYLGKFNYRAGYDQKDAVIVAKADGTFLLIGTMKKPQYMGLEVDSQLFSGEEAIAADETSGEGDFGSLF